MTYPGPAPAGQPAPDPAAQDRALRTMSLAFLTMSVVFGVLLVVAEGTGTPNLVYVALAVLVVVIGFLLAQSLGYRPAPAAAAARPGAPSQFMAAFFRRVALTEAPVFVNLVIGFIAGSAWPYLIAWPFAFASMAFHLIPTEATHRRWEAHQKC